MCLNPLNIRNPTKNIVKQGGQLLKLEVPCGKCAECIQAKRNEWYIRSYYECQHCIANGGFVYFDTLTYAPQHLPMLSRYVDVKKYGITDHSCFSVQDYRKFFKRLRRLLERKYPGVKFKYFLTTEYGEDETRTHRPHYHILFFVYGDIHPLVFSTLVNKCWGLGRTDGRPWKSVKYVANHVYGVDLGFGNFNTPDIMASVCMYVAKYITKSNRFREQLLKRMDILRCALRDDDKFNSILREVDMFHRQSQGFGLSYIYKNDERVQKALEMNIVVLDDAKSIIKEFPLPMYYKRHLYYTCKQRADKTRYWELTPIGVDHNNKLRLASVDTKCIEYMDLLNNSSEDDRYVFFKLLGNRDISELVVYQLFYRGRLRHCDSVNHYLEYCPDFKLTDEELNLFDWLELQEYSSKNNSLPFGECFLSDEKHVYPLRRYYEPFLFHDDPCNWNKLTYQEFIDRYTFNEYSCPEFKNFDRLLEFIKKLQKQDNKNAQKTFEFMADLKERFKTFMKNI